jgi:hypothetical protein
MPENTATKTEEKPKFMDRLTRAQKIAGGIITALAGLAGAAAVFFDSLSKLFGGQ